MITATLCAAQFLDGLMIWRFLHQGKIKTFSCPWRRFLDLFEPSPFGDPGFLIGNITLLREQIVENYLLI
jgi:hypothetical protein